MFAKKTRNHELAMQSFPLLETSRDLPRPRADYPETPSGRGSRAFKWRSAPRRPSLRRSRRDWASLGLAALFGVTLNQLFLIGGLARTSAAHTALIVALGPVMVLALSRLLRMEA